MVRVRPIDVEDLESLQAFEKTLSPSNVNPSEGLLTRASVSFFERTGHAFVAEDGNGVRGVILAQAVWDGVRPTVRMQHLLTADEDLTVRAALLEALTKSAYDAAVYDLVAELPRHDPVTKTWLEENSWREEPTTLFRRTLGSRGA